MEDSAMVASKANAVVCKWCSRPIAVPDIPCSTGSDAALHMLLAHPRGDTSCKAELKSRGF
jgi:hypothetical protein